MSLFSTLSKFRMKFSLSFWFFVAYLTFLMIIPVQYFGFQTDHLTIIRGRFLFVRFSFRLWTGCEWSISRTISCKHSNKKQKNRFLHLTYLLPGCERGDSRVTRLGCVMKGLWWHIGALGTSLHPVHRQRNRKSLSYRLIIMCKGAHFRSITKGRPSTRI